MTHFVASLLLLQTPPAGGSSGGLGLLPLLFQFGAIFLIFYFIMIRPQQRQRKQHEQRLRELKKGDEIVTSGGIVGKVAHIKEATKEGKAEKTMDDHITIVSAESTRLVVERGRIARVITPTPAASTKTEASAAS
jgi:preprotein translocase subunit YajC